MAFAERLPSKRWRGGYRDSSGKQRYVPGTFGRKSDAKDAAYEAQVKAKRQVTAERGTLSPKTVWGDWWDIVADRLRGDTDTDLTEASIARNHLLPRWGDTPLNQIASRDVRLWISDLSARYSPSFVRRVYGVFSMSINRAVEHEILPATPCVGVRMPKAIVQPQRYVSLEQAADITPQISAEYADAVTVMLETGLRPNEVAGLHTHRVDLKARTLTVVETWVHYKRVMRPWPKDRETRILPLTQTAVDVLGRRLTKASGDSCGRTHSDGATCRHDLVFRGPNGGIMDAPALSQVLRRLDGDATPYALRRGFATRAAEGGLDAFELARMMGHANIQQTQPYVQQTPSARARVLAALGDRPDLHVVRRRGADVERTSDNGQHNPAQSETREGVSDQR